MDPIFKERNEKTVSKNRVSKGHLAVFWYLKPRFKGMHNKLEDIGHRDQLIHMQQRIIPNLMDLTQASSSSISYEIIFI